MMMKSFLTSLCMAVFACLSIGSSALVPYQNFRGMVSISRRNVASKVMSSIFGGAMALTVATSPLVAAVQPVNAAVIDKGEAFVGKYSDPNHPGGTREIRLLEGNKIGNYDLLEVVGTGGSGEPKKYTLPAVAIGDRYIIIDFTPKGGPADYEAVLTKTGGLKFVRDGNVWPRIEEQVS